jgi:hypothetical protein
MVSSTPISLPAKANHLPEIVQQSKIRKKEEFLRAFDPIVVGGSTLAYKSSPSDIQSKMRRVFEVWKSRQVFRPQIIEELERGLDGTFEPSSTSLRIC